jgi:hypothetical protein
MTELRRIGTTLPDEISWARSTANLLTPSAESQACDRCGTLATDRILVNVERHGEQVYRRVCPDCLERRRVRRTHVGTCREAISATIPKLYLGARHQRHAGGAEAFFRPSVSRRRNIGNWPPSPTVEPCCLSIGNSPSDSPIPKTRCSPCPPTASDGSIATWRKRESPKRRRKVGWTSTLYAAASPPLPQNQKAEGRCLADTGPAVWH